MLETWRSFRQKTPPPMTYSDDLLEESRTALNSALFELTAASLLISELEYCDLEELRDYTRRINIAVKESKKFRKKATRILKKLHKEDRGRQEREKHSGSR